MKKLLKCVTVLLLSTSASVVSSAKSVDENTAKTIGCNYLISTGIQAVKSAADLTTSYVATAKINGKVVNDYYVFNFKNGNGYVMVSADDNVIPILSYSPESPFDINTINPIAKSWIEGYQNQITAVIKNNIAAERSTITAWNDLSVAKPAVPAPKGATARTTSITFPNATQYLLTTKWDQGTGYNTYCPGPSSSRSVTGCVATCMSEVMQFWNWPSVGCGSHTYTPPAGLGYPAQTADFGNTAYNWTSMNSSLAAGNTAIATLMYHAGVSIDMDYSPTESGAYVISMESPVINCAEYAMKTYFHYKPTLRGIPRFGEQYTSGVYYVDSIAQATWISILKTELDAQRPVIYSGEEPAAGGGHCWVCDGYNASSMFHFNWGWSGASNAWYTVDNLAPPALGIGGGSGNFNQDQCAIIGIMPDTYPTATGNIELAAHLDCTTSQGMTYNTGFSIVTQIQNAGTSSFSGDFCAQVFDTLNHLVTTVETFTGKTIAAAGTLPLTFTTTGQYLMIPANHYHVQVMYRTSSSAAWAPVANNGTFINYNILDVEDNSTLKLTDAITITGGSTTLVTGHPLTLSAQLTDYDVANFSGSVQAVLINASTGATTNIQLYTGQNISSGYSFSFTFHSASVAVPVGTYVLAIQHQPGGTGSFVYTSSDFFENPIIMNVVSGTGVSTVSQTADNIAVYPNPANDVMNIALNGVDASEITICDIQGRELQKITPVRGQDIVTVPVSNFAAGVYFVRLQAGSDMVTKKIVITK